MPLSTETATARRLPRHSPRRTSCAASQGRWPFTSTRWSTSPTARTCATPFIGKGRQSLLGPLPADRSPEEAWEDAVHPDDRDSVEFASQRLERDEPAEVEYRLVGYDGRTRWVWDRMRPRRTPDGRLLVDGIVADISERKAAAEALEAAQRELHHIAFHDALTGLPTPGGIPGGSERRRGPVSGRALRGRRALRRQRQLQARERQLRSLGRRRAPVCDRRPAPVGD